jgi:LuxR family maltose regulon positive regulatory protein
MHSEITTFLGWVDALPDELVRDRPDLCVFHAWSLLLSNRPPDVIESRLQDAARSGDGSKVAPLRALVAVYQGQISRAGELSRQALERLSEDARFLRGLAAWILSMSQLADGDLNAGRQALNEVIRMSLEIGNVMVAAAALSNLAKLRIRQGRLHEAKATYERALELATDRQGRPLPIASEALMGLGDLLREWNELKTATRYLTEGIELTRRWGEAPAVPESGPARP